jgi:hypothetical protein
MSDLAPDLAHGLAIEARGLVKVYRNVDAVDGLSLSVREAQFMRWWVATARGRRRRSACCWTWRGPMRLGGRVIAIVVLLLAAQFVLERREIRA